jgi:hypothetical protein
VRRNGGVDVKRIPVEPPARVLVDTQDHGFVWRRGRDRAAMLQPTVDPGLAGRAGLVEAPPLRLPPLPPHGERALPKHLRRELGDRLLCRLEETKAIQ